jgi:hypothetical protein
MLNYGKEESRCILDKIRKEDASIGTEVKKFKQYYLNKAVEGPSCDNFVRLLRHLKVLLVSHCKNICQLAPESTLSAVQ